MSDAFAVGIDIGGTKVAYVLADRSGHVHQTHTVPMQADLTPEDISAGVQAVLGEISVERISGVGIGVPGRVNTEAGVVLNAVNLGWHDVHLVERMQRILPVPTYMQMDVRAALLGEMMFGAASGTESVVQVAIGTGLGGAAFINGDVVGGAHMFPMELGHMHMQGWQRQCSCGGVGCVETVLAGKGVLLGIDDYRNEYPDSPLVGEAAPTTYEWIQALPTEDPMALRILEDMRQVWHQLLNIIYVTLNPEIVVLSGGLGLAIADYLLDDIDATLHTKPYCLIDFPVVVKRSTLASSALGATALVWHNT